MATNRKNNNSVAWANALDEISKDQIKSRQPEGPGWQTFSEILEIVKIGQSKLRQQIKAGLKNGSILIFEGQDFGIDGQRRKKIWYKIKS